MSKLCSSQTGVLVALWSSSTLFGADVGTVDSSDVRSAISGTGDNIGPTNDHAVEMPSAEHSSDVAVDGPAPPMGTPPSRSNSPAAPSGSESTNASLGALQVASSPGAVHDETWNSFLDVCPFPALSRPVNHHICLRRIWALQRHFAEGRAPKVSRSTFPSDPRSPNLHSNPERP
jgi:hypothetical protein